MSNANRLLAAALALAGLCAAPVVWGEDEAAPPEHRQGPVSYVVGGIGSDEAQAMRRAEGYYPLTLELAAPTEGGGGEYVANARVEIRDLHGQSLLSTTADGPLMLIRLPSGTYAVDVAWNGAVEHKTVAIAEGKRQHIVFAFPREHSTQ
jgi:hypothetical protein